MTTQVTVMHEGAHSSRKQPWPMVERQIDYRKSAFSPLRALSLSHLTVALSLVDLQIEAILCHPLFTTIFPPTKHLRFR